MGLFRRRSSNVDEESETGSRSPQKVASQDASVSSEEVTEPDLSNETDMMLEVVLKLREDVDFAKSMYADCPRLQHLLNRNPGLRPIFEEPSLICANFEKVFVDNGGILPEDAEKNRPSWFQRMINEALKRLRIITQSRWFKVFKCLLLVKKCLGLVNPTKAIGLMNGCVKSMCCSCLEDADELIEDADADGDADDPHRETKQSLNKAAEYMEDPDVQEEMERIMDNPESMDNAIEQNENLRGLRESNPVCRELMSDPDSMKILTNPDNLRALGDCAEMVEADFGDVDFEPPDAEVDFGGETDMPEMENDLADVEMENQDSRLPGIEEVDETDLDEMENNEGIEQQNADLEEGEEEGMGGPTADDLEDVEYNERQGGSSSRARSRQQQRKRQGGKSGGGRFSGVTDAAVGFLGGAVFGELTDGLSPFGGDDMGGIDDIDAEEPPEVEPLGVEDSSMEEIESPDAETVAEDAALVTMIGASILASGDDLDAVTDTAFDQVENMEDVAEHGEDDRDRDKRAAAAGAAGAAGGVGVAAREKSGDDEENSDEEDKPKGFRGFLGNAASALKDAAKESLMAAVIGEDATEFLVDDLEREEEDDEAEKEKKDSHSDTRKSEGAKTESQDASIAIQDGDSALETANSYDDDFANALDR